MKTKKLFTSLAAAVMLSAGLAGTVSVKHRTVSATVIVIIQSLLSS